MGYKFLGYLVWHGGKWYARRRLQGTRRSVALSAVVALVLVGLLCASRQRSAQRS
jgi:hypothetical protein